MQLVWPLFDERPSGRVQISDGEIARKAAHQVIVGLCGACNAEVQFSNGVVQSFALNECELTPRFPCPVYRRLLIVFATILIAFTLGVFLTHAAMLLTGETHSGDDDSSSESQESGKDSPHIFVQLEVLADDVLRLHLLLSDELLSAVADCRLPVPVV